VIGPAAIAGHPHVRLVLRLVVGAVFLAASLDKIAHPLAFAKAVSYYHVLPSGSEYAFALFVPWTEAVIGAALVLGLASRGAAAITGALLLVFVIALVSAIARGIDISCGCFSTTPGEGHKVGIDLVVRDILMLAACVPIVRLGGGTFSLDGVLRRRGGAAVPTERSAA
jgi:uncharacterized membrane protein YphA (DoxX/SURF4 family)